MPLIPPRDLQPLRRAPMVLRTHIPLRTVPVHGKPQPTRRDRARERDADRPIRVDATAIVLSIRRVFDCGKDHFSAFMNVVLLLIQLLVFVQGPRWIYCI